MKKSQWLWAITRANARALVAEHELILAVAVGILATVAVLL